MVRVHAFDKGRMIVFLRVCAVVLIAPPSPVFCSFSSHFSVYFATPYSLISILALYCKALLLFCSDISTTHNLDYVSFVLYFI